MDRLYLKEANALKKQIKSCKLFDEIRIDWIGTITKGVLEDDATVSNKGLVVLAILGDTIALRIVSDMGVIQKFMQDIEKRFSKVIVFDKNDFDTVSKYNANNIEIVLVIQ